MAVIAVVVVCIGAGVAYKMVLASKMSLRWWQHFQPRRLRHRHPPQAALRPLQLPLRLQAAVSQVTTAPNSTASVSPRSPKIIPLRCPQPPQRARGELRTPPTRWTAKGKNSSNPSATSTTRPGNPCHRRFVFVPILFAGLLGLEELPLAADPTTASTWRPAMRRTSSATSTSSKPQRDKLLVCASPSCPPTSARSTWRKSKRSTRGFSDHRLLREGWGGGRPHQREGHDRWGASGRPARGYIYVGQRLGEHTFVFETAGQKPVTKTLIIVQGQKRPARHESRSGHPQAEVPKPAVVTPVASVPAASPPSAVSRACSAQTAQPAEEEPHPGHYGRLRGAGRG